MILRRLRRSNAFMVGRPALRARGSRAHPRGIDRLPCGGRRRLSVARLPSVANLAPVDRAGQRGPGRRTIPPSWQPRLALVRALARAIGRGPRAMRPTRHKSCAQCHCGSPARRS
jgi:hypothetical protein